MTMYYSVTEIDFGIVNFFLQFLERGIFILHNFCYLCFMVVYKFQGFSDVIYQTICVPNVISLGSGGSYRSL